MVDLYPAPPPPLKDRQSVEVRDREVKVNATLYGSDEILQLIRLLQGVANSMVKTNVEG